MRAGMQTLLELVREELNGRGIAAEECMLVLDLAEQENILPWAASCLRAQTEYLAPDVEARLRTVEREARISAFVWSETLRSTLAEFHRRGVPAISLKGPWLAQRFYGDAALRLYSDLDLLVRKADFDRAGEALASLGFSAAARREDYALTWSRGGITLELHDDVENPLAFDFGIEAAWDRAQPAEFEGVPAWLLAPSDELRFLCLHGVRHRFERLSHVLDLVLAFRQVTFRQGTRTQAEAGASARMLAFGWMMAARLDSRVVEMGADYTSTPYCWQLERTAEALWKERMREPAAMLDWRSKHLFLAAMERPGWDRWRAGVRHLRILSTRLIANDFAFAARFHLDRTWQVWLLRPLRLLLGAFRASPETL